MSKTFEGYFSSSGLAVSGKPPQRQSSRNAMRFMAYQRSMHGPSIDVNKPKSAVLRVPELVSSSIQSAVYQESSRHGGTRQASSVPGNGRDRMPETRRNLLLIDDHTLFRTGLKLILADHPAIGTIFEAGSVMSAIERLGGAPVDLILLDVQLPGISGLDGALLLKRAFSDARIVLLSGSVDAIDLQKLSGLGLSGQLPKSEDPARLIEVIMRCLAGHDDPSTTRISDNGRADRGVPPAPALTARQIEVLKHLCQGQSNKVIAGHLGLAENTVRVHVAAILDQLMVNSRTEAVIEAQRRGLISL